MRFCRAAQLDSAHLRSGEHMENEEQSPSDNLEPEIGTQKPKRRFVSWIVAFALIAWFFNSNVSNEKISSNSNSNSEYESIISQSKLNFFDKFESGPINSNAIVYLDETITESESVRIYENIDLAMEYLHVPLTAKTFDIRIFDDFEALKKDMLNMTPASVFDSVKDDLSPKGVFGLNKDCEVEGSVGVAYDEGWFRPRIFILTECSWQEQSDGTWLLMDPEVIAHEISHVAQNYWFGSDFFTWSCFVPNWFTEGQPQFISAQIASLEGEFDYELFRKSWVYWDPDGNVKPHEDYESEYGQYSDGAFAIEYLVGKYGWEKIDLLVTKLNIAPVYECETSDIHERFSSAFKLTYGISLDKFYDEVADYILWNLDDLDYQIS